MKSQIDYIVTNDFEGAKQRFDNANKRWKKHWYETCLIIAKKVKDLFKKYIFDPVNLTITKINEKLKKIQGKSFVYLIKMFDENNNYVFLKVGKSNNVDIRLMALSKQYYKKDKIKISRVEKIHTWELPNSHLAEAFEQVLHSFLSSHYINIPNDRYPAINLLEEDLIEFEKRYKLMESFF